VSTGLLVVAFSVEMVAAKKRTWASRHIGKVQPEVQRSAETKSSDHIYLRCRQRTLGYFTSLHRLRRCHLNLYLRPSSSCALPIPPVSGTIPRSRAEHPNINRTESRLLTACSVTRAGIESRSVEAAPCSDDGAGGAVEAADLEGRRLEAATSVRKDAGRARGVRPRAKPTRALCAEVRKTNYLHHRHGFGPDDGVEDRQARFTTCPASQSRRGSPGSPQRLTNAEFPLALARDEKRVPGIPSHLR